MNQDPKPGYKTTEFWMSYTASTLSFLYASGVLGGLDENSTLMQAIGFISGALITLGYAVSRGLAKKGSV